MHPRFGDKLLGTRVELFLLVVKGLTVRSIIPAALSLAYSDGVGRDIPYSSYS